MSFARNAAVSTVGNIVPPLLALLTQPLLAQNLGVDGRGVAAAGVAPLMVAVSIGALGLPDALNRYIAQQLATRRQVFAVMGALVVLGLFASVSIVSISVVLAGDSEEAKDVIRLGAWFAAPILLFQGMRGVAAGLKLWSAIALARSAQSALLLLLVAVGSISNTLTVRTAVVALALAQCAGVVILIWAVLRRQNSKSPSNSHVSSRGIVSYAWTIWIGSAAGYLLARLDQMLITPLGGVGELGLYAVAVSISEIVLVANAGLREVVFSAESAVRDPVRVASATRISNLIVFTLSFMAAVATPILIEPLFGRDFGASVPMVMILLLAISVGNPGSVSGMALAAWGHPGLRSVSILVALLFNIVGIVTLVPILGGIGAAFATLMGNCVAMTMILRYMKVIYNISPAEFIFPTRSDFVSIVRLLKTRGGE